MDYAFPDIAPHTAGQVYNIPVPMSRYLEASYDEGVHYTVLGALNRMSEMSYAEADDSPIIDAKQANERFAVGNLKFDQPVRESVARIMNRRKRDEMDREFFLTNGASKTRFLPGMAASMIGGMMNPVDLGLMFVPFVGTEEAALKAVDPIGRAMARGLITRETLQNMFPKAPALTASTIDAAFQRAWLPTRPEILESIVNGVAGQTLFEIPNVIAARQDQSNYGLGQAATNIVLGGAAAAALHTALHSAGTLFSKLTPGTREQMMSLAFNQHMRDEVIKVHDYVKLDEEAIWAKVKFDEDAARSRAYDSIDMDVLAKAVMDQYSETVVSPAIKTSTGKIITADSHAQAWNKVLPDEDPRVAGETFVIVGDNEGFITDTGRFISREEAGKLVGIPDIGYNHSLWENDKLMSEQISTANPNELGAAEFDRYNQLIEENPHLSKVDALKTIMKERERRRDRFIRLQPHIQEKMELARQAAIKDFIEKERIKFEQEKQGKFDALKQQEIERQIAAGKTMPPEEIQAKIPPEKFDGSADAELDADIGALKKDVKIAEETQKKESIFHAAAKKVDEYIKELSKPGTTKMFTGVTGIEPLIALVGKEITKGLLIAVREGLKLTGDLTKAIDHAMEWYSKESKKSKTRSVMDKEIPLAKEEIRAKIREAKESGNKEEVSKWEKILNPQMDRRGFLSTLGKIVAATTVDPTTLIPKTIKTEHPLFDVPFFKIVNALEEPMHGDSVGGMTEFLEQVADFNIKYLDLDNAPAVQKLANNLTDAQLREFAEGKYGGGRDNWMGKAIKSGGDDKTRLKRMAAQDVIAKKLFGDKISGVAHHVEGKYSGLHDAVSDNFTLGQMVKYGLIEKDVADAAIHDIVPLLKGIMDSIKDQPYYVLADRELAHSLTHIKGVFPEFSAAIEAGKLPALERDMAKYREDVVTATNKDEKELAEHFLSKAEKQYAKEKGKIAKTTEEKVREHLEGVIKEEIAKENKPYLKTEAEIRKDVTEYHTREWAYAEHDVATGEATSFEESIKNALDGKEQMNTDLSPEQIAKYAEQFKDRPEFKELIEEEVRSNLKFRDEQLDQMRKPQTKAIEAAVECILRKMI